MIDTLLHWPPEWWAALPREFAFLLTLPFVVGAAAFAAECVRRRCRRD